MDKEAQRIAIAEACGWVIHDKEGLFGRHKHGAYSTTIPNYLNDLNAMHEAEIHLRNNYPKLFRNVYIRRYLDFGYEDAITASATQRAEAFLRTLELWKD